MLPAGTRYLGTAADIAAAVEATETAMLPERTRHLGFGDVAAVWGMLEKLDVAAIIDEVAGPCPAGLPLPAGTYLALAALNRLVDPCSKRAFADWWKTTAADRFTKIPASALDHRRFWDAMHAVTVEQLAPISRVTSGAWPLRQDTSAHPGAPRLRYSGRAPRCCCPALTGLPPTARVLVDRERLGGPPALAPRREVYGTERRAILTHSPELHQSQA